MDVIAVRRAVKRVHNEMRHRINKKWPIARQVEMQNAALARLLKLDLSTGAQHLVDLDCVKMEQMIEDVTRYRLAAGLLVRKLEAGEINPHEFNFADNGYWEN